MEIIILLAAIAGVVLLIFFLKRRARDKHMYIKREHHIQAFPPDHRNSRR